MTSEETIVTFFTTHAALRAEKVLKQAGIAAQLVPAPRELSADCTIALVFPAAHHQRVRELLQSLGIETSCFHEDRRGGRSSNRAG